MKRKLLVIRHAHTESGSPDHARQLTARGRGDALRVAARIQQLGWTPQKVLSSDAARTTQTVEHMNEVFEADVDVTYTNDLYLADVDSALDELYALPDDVSEAGVIGHNPGWQELVRWLCGVAVRMSPCTAVLLTGSGDTWADALQQNRWELEEVIRPEAL